MKSHKHRAKIIEIYENGAKAAVQFTSGRVECVLRRGLAAEFKIGMTGTVDYVPSLQGFEWTFTPAKVRNGGCRECSGTFDNHDMDCAVYLDEMAGA